MKQPVDFGSHTQCLTQCFTKFSKLYVESVITIDIDLSMHKKENKKDRHLCFRKCLYFTYSHLDFCILDLIFFYFRKM